MVSETQSMTVITEPTLCIDRLTLLMQTGPCMGFYGSVTKDYYQKTNPEIKAFIAQLRARFHDFFENLVSRESELYLYHFRLIGGFDLQMCPKFGVKCRIKDEEFVLDDNSGYTDGEKDFFVEKGYIDEYFDSDFGIRIEFNPAKSNLSDIAPVLSFLCNHYGKINPDISFDRLFKVTRMDVAVDYPAQLNLSLFTVLKKRKSGFVGGSDGVETVYFGTRRSPYYFRIYDKKKELKEQQNVIYLGEALMRIELECKNPISIGEDPHSLCQQFRQIEYFYGVKTGDWSFDMFLFYAMSFGMQNALKMLPRDTKKRYFERYSKLDMDSIKHPARIVGWDLPPMWRRLYDDLKNVCGRSCDRMLFERNFREVLNVI